AGSEIGAYFDVLSVDDAVDRRAQQRVLRVLACLGEARLHLPELQPGVVHLLLRYAAGGERRLVALQIAPRLVHARLRALQVGAGHLIVYARKHLSGPHRATFLNKERNDAPGGLGAEINLMYRAEVAVGDERAVEGGISRLRGKHRDCAGAAFLYNRGARFIML